MADTENSFSVHESEIESTSSESETEEESERVHCNCKNTCQRRKCPCKAAGLHCAGSCSCGTRSKPCKNKATRDGAAETVSNVRATRAELLQEYVSTLSEEQCKAVILNFFSNKGGVDLVKSALISDPPTGPPQQPNDLPWCLCGYCCPMPTEIENKCCRLRTCTTRTDLFESIVLDLNVLTIAIINRSETFVSPLDYSPASYRKAAYRQYVLWKEGRLGRGNRIVVPSCVVWSVRTRYPAPDGQYLGFKEYNE